MITPEKPLFLSEQGKFRLLTDASVTNVKYTSLMHIRVGGGAIWRTYDCQYVSPSTSGIYQLFMTFNSGAMTPCRHSASRLYSSTTGFTTEAAAGAGVTFLETSTTSNTQRSLTVGTISALKEQNRAIAEYHQMGIRRPTDEAMWLNWVGSASHYMYTGSAWFTYELWTGGLMYIDATASPALGFYLSTNATERTAASFIIIEEQVLW